MQTFFSYACCVRQAHRSCFVPAGALWGAGDITKMADRGNLAALTGRACVCLSISGFSTLYKLPWPSTLRTFSWRVVCGRHWSVMWQTLPIKRLVFCGRYATKEHRPLPAETLCKGPVRDLCPLAPNNVNTMACAALAAHNLGFDKTVGTSCRFPNAVVTTRSVVRMTFSFFNMTHSRSIFLGCLIADKSLQAHVITIEALGPVPSDGGDRFAVTTTRHNPAKPGAVTGSATFASFLSSLLAACRSPQQTGVHFC
jgi:aspartate dehydrogenase